MRAWLSSLLAGKTNVYVSSLYSEGLRDGYVLLQAVDAIQPGAVDWRRVCHAMLCLRWHYCLELFVGVELCCGR